MAATHREKLLRWFGQRKTLTGREALQHLSISAASQRITDLRKAGHDIITETIDVTNADGTTSRVARYHYLGRVSHEHPV